MAGSTFADTEGAAGAALVRLFERQRAAFARDPWPDHAMRVARLRLLLRAVLEHREEIAAAVNADFGGRSWHETMLVDVFGVVSLIRYTIANLRRWMRPQRRRVELFLQPARAEVWFQPKGVVGIIAPWNYPLYLSLGPLSAALAAGNRAIVKPSEAVPATSDVIARMLSGVFDEDLVAVAIGGHDVAASLSALPLDHLFFTGSAAAGRAVMRSAAEHLTPVTLELGGKSPLIVHRDYPVPKAVKRLVAGKFFNAGQTCVAPDYALVHRERSDEFVAELERQIGLAYPGVDDNPDFASIVDDRHHARLLGLIADARAKGARIVEVVPGARESGATSRRIGPTLVLDVDNSMTVMREEIFGPVLPIVTYESLDAAIAFVNGQPRPLSLYYFDDNRSRSRRVLQRTLSGAACINEAALHVLDADLPFGGVGASGFGAYHSEAGFRTFSHARAVLSRGRINPADLLAPPYGRLFERFLALVIGSTNEKKRTGPRP
jgi:coniferyl-aldehyde dehydrogenase